MLLQRVRLTVKLLKLVLQQHSLLKKVGDTMTGRLIIPKDSYPVQGDLNKVINQGGDRSEAWDRETMFSTCKAVKSKRGQQC